MRFLHRFYDLHIGGAEVVVLNTVKALPNVEHVLLFTNWSRNWIHDELSELPNATLHRVEQDSEPEVIRRYAADANLFHYYPPMSDADFARLLPGDRAKTILVNHWHEPVPEIPDIGFLFLSEESFSRAEKDIPRSRCSTIMNPVSNSFFEVDRTPIPNSIGRHSRNVELKFSRDFFDLTEGFRVPDLQVLVLGPTESLTRFTQENRHKLNGNYWMIHFGSMAVEQFLRWPEIYFYRTDEHFAETCPLNILEAMAAGIPIVAERKGGITSLIRHGETGFLCEARTDFRDAIERLINDCSLRKTLGSNAKRWARDEASLGQYGARLLQAIDGLLSAKDIRTSDGT